MYSIITIVREVTEGRKEVVSMGRSHLLQKEKKTLKTIRFCNIV